MAEGPQAAEDWPEFRGKGRTGEWRETGLLEKFPADANVLRPPKLALPAPEEDLGTLEPGKDHKFEVRISNQGMLVLHGTAATDCEWLTLGDKNNASSMKMLSASSTSA